MTAFQATFVGLQPIASRKVYKLVFEVATENVNAALDVLGGVPDPANPAWVGIARIDHARASPPVAASKRERLPSERAWALCQSGRFANWLCGNSGATEAAVTSEMRARLGIVSRTELDTDPAARARFEALEAEYKKASR